MSLRSCVKRSKWDSRSEGDVCVSAASVASVAKRQRVRVRVRVRVKGEDGKRVRAVLQVSAVGRSL